jgi:hypothetical protein
MDCNQVCVGIARFFGNMAYYVFVFVIGMGLLFLALEQIAVGLGKLRIVLGRIRFECMSVMATLQQTWLRWSRPIDLPPDDAHRWAFPATATSRAWRRRKPDGAVAR